MMMQLSEILQNDTDRTPSYSEKRCEFCNELRESVALGSFTYYRQCNCTGAVSARAAADAAARLIESERQRQRVERLLERAGLTMGRAAEQSLATFEGANQTAWAIEYVTSLASLHDAVWPIFTGPFGTGKTHWARGIARAAIEQYQYRVSFVNYLRWYHELKSDFEHEKQRLATVMATDVLIIDDLDKQKLTDYSQQKLYEIIDHRYEIRRPVIITANTSDLGAFLLRSAGDKIGGAIYDRLEEVAQWVRFTGASYRRRL